MTAHNGLLARVVVPTEYFFVRRSEQDKSGEEKDS